MNILYKSNKNLSISIKEYIENLILKNILKKIKTKNKTFKQAENF